MSFQNGLGHQLCQKLFRICARCSFTLVFAKMGKIMIFLDVLDFSSAHVPCVLKTVTGLSNSSSQLQWCQMPKFSTRRSGLCITVRTLVDNLPLSKTKCNFYIRNLNLQRSADIVDTEALLVSRVLQLTRVNECPFRAVVYARTTFGVNHTIA